jgi:hypothetical protein
MPGLNPDAGFEASKFNRASILFEDGSHQADQLPGLIGFGQKPVRLGARVLIDLLIHGSADQNDLLLRVDLPAPADQIEPGHPVHGVIGNDQIGARVGGGESLQRLFGILEGLDCVPGGLQQGGGQLDQQRFVVDDKNEGFGGLIHGGRCGN